MTHPSAMGRRALLSLVLLSASTIAGETPLIGAQNPEAHAGIEQYGQFVGTWTCAPAARQPDGSLKEFPARPTWVWHYALNGHAIQDVWIPDPENPRPGASMGTNLRVYDPEKDQWVMVWATETLNGFQQFTARMVDGEMVMHGDITLGPHPPHKARITFYNISEAHFDWKYESSKLNDGELWSLAATLSCDRSEHAS